MREAMNSKLFERLSKGMLLGSLALLFVVGIHIFVKFAGVVPRVSVDEGLANVGHNLSAFGRLGIMTTPLQPHAALPRSEVFYNYGPWYFSVLGAFEWVFGQSITLARMLHPLGLGLISAISLIAFRKASLAAGSAAGCILFVLFLEIQFPMIRPDIAVAVFASMCLLFTTRALEGGSPVAWALAAASSAGAFTSHQIAFSLPIFVLVIWAASSFHLNVTSTERSTRTTLGNFFAIAVGGLTVFLIYLWAVDFNIKTLLGLWFGYSDFVSAKNPISYSEVVDTHLVYFGGAYAKIFLFIELIGIAVASILVVLNFRRPSSHLRKLIAYSLPGPVLFLLYLGSLTLYPNFHTGYVLVLHAALAWSVCGVGVVFVNFLATFQETRLKYAEVCCRVFASLLIVFVAGYYLFVPTYWERQAYGNVEFEELKSHVISGLPPRARVFGQVEFGIDSGNRFQLISFYEGLALASDFAIEDRGRLRPDAVLIGRTASTAYAQAIFRGRSADWPIEDIFPGVSIRLIRSVYARPYGEMRVYKVAGSAEALSDVSRFGVIDGTTGQWIDRFVPVDHVVFDQIPPVKFSFEYRRAGVDTALASQSWKTRRTLPPGQYLVEAKIQHDGKRESGIVAATSTDDYRINVSDDSFQFDHAYYFKSEERAYLQVDHKGGPLYFSHISVSPDSRLTLTGLRKANPIRSDRTELSMSVPGYAEWTATAESSRIDSLDEGTFRLRGLATPWEDLYLSPSVPVPPASVMRLEIPVSSGGNDVLVGVKSGERSWLMPPRSISNDLVFETKNARSVNIVLLAAGDKATPATYEIVLARGKLIAVGGDAGLYTDWLTICRHRKIESESRHLMDWGNATQASFKCEFEQNRQ